MTEKKAKLRAVDGVKDLHEERSKALVEKLESFIEMAKEGHLSDLVLIGKIRGAPMTEMEWEADDPLSLLGALEMAKQEVVLDLLQDHEDADEED